MTPFRCDRILVPTDLSPFAEKAVRYAHGLAVLQTFLDAYFRLRTCRVPDTRSLKGFRNDLASRRDDRHIDSVKGNVVTGLHHHVMMLIASLDIIIPGGVESLADAGGRIGPAVLPPFVSLTILNSQTVVINGVNGKSRV